MIETEKKASTWPWIAVPIAAVTVFFLLRECQHRLPPADPATVPVDVIPEAPAPTAAPVDSAAEPSADTAAQAAAPDDESTPTEPAPQ